MACRLCQKDKPLQNSHVVPEFFYKPSYDKKHRIYARISGKLAHMPPLQKGLREPLLCRDCEQKLSPYEKYNREILYGGVDTHGLTPVALEIPNPDQNPNSNWILPVSTFS